MSLYDDIDIPNEENEKDVVSETMRPLDETSRLLDEPKTTFEKPTLTPGLSFLKSQLESRKAQLPVNLKPTSVQFSMKPLNVIQSRPSSVQKPLSTLRTKRVQPLQIDATSTFSILPKAIKEDKVYLFNELLVEDEYNPTAPTDYESFKPNREAQLARERAAREVAERIEKQHSEEESKRHAGAAIAPPNALMEQDAQLLQQQVSENSLPRDQVAANIMSRMGYKEGFGLGRDEQGMTSALHVKKISKNKGVIVDETRPLPEMEIAKVPTTSTIGPQAVPAPNDLSAINTAPLVLGPKMPPPINITKILSNASKVVLVTNMVLPSDVDDELKEEVEEEMQKYGQLTNVKVHVMKDAAEDEAVRIFVEFTNQAQAIKAVIDLNKRFFGGRSIRARFYNIEDFAAKKLDK